MSVFVNDGGIEKEAKMIYVNDGGIDKLVAGGGEPILFVGADVGTSGVLLDVLAGDLVLLLTTTAELPSEWTEIGRINNYILGQRIAAEDGQIELPSVSGSPIQGLLAFRGGVGGARFINSGSATPVSNRVWVPAIEDFTPYSFKIIVGGSYRAPTSRPRFYATHQMSVVPGTSVPATPDMFRAVMSLGQLAEDRDRQVQTYANSEMVIMQIEVFPK